MRLKYLTHPRTKQPDPMLTLAYIVTLICAVKFFFEGVTVEFYGHVLTLGHADALTYGALLTPVLGAHASREWKIPNPPSPPTEEPPMAIDNPDEE